MRHGLGVLAAIAAWFGASAATAQDFCRDLRVLVSEARTEFASITGERLPGAPSPDLSVFRGARQLAGAAVCVVGQQTANGRRFSTSYTCSGAGPDTNEGIAALGARVAQCLDLVAWAEQRQSDFRGPWLSQYGLIRLSITRNGPAGLALGVEVFRDERGAVMGSPTRGDTVDASGRRRCTPKTPEEIARLIAMYGEKPGAERFEDEQFIGYRNQTSQPTVAFATRPAHPAHPAIITRGVIEQDGLAVLTAGGDFGGDCQAFHELLDQVVEMNRNVQGQPP